MRRLRVFFLCTNTAADCTWNLSLLHLVYLPAMRRDRNGSDLFAANNQTANGGAKGSRSVPVKQEYAVTQLIATICLTTIAIGLLLFARQAFIAFLNYIVPPY
jgi:hypothetical protein